MPIYEPGLEELVERNVRAGRLGFTTSYEQALRAADFVFIAVGTPSGVDGEADLQHVRAVAEAIARTMDHSMVDHQQVDRPRGHGRLGGRHPARHAAQAHSLRRRLVPRVPARGLRHPATS